MRAIEHASNQGSAGEGRARLRVRVVPGSQRSTVVGRLGESWKLRVQAPPERGRANGEIVALLAGHLGLKRSQVYVVAGHTARDKVIELDGLSVDEAERRLASAARDAG